MPDLKATTPLDGYDKTFGETKLAEVADLALVSLACPLGGDAAFEAALAKGVGTKRPAPGMSSTGGTPSTGGTARAIWMTPDQVMLAFSHATPDAATHVADKVGDAAYLTDQTDNWCALSLAGSLARPALERICPLDLHTEAFATDAAARTVMEHMGVMILRTGEDEFLLLSASSSAGSFLHAVETSLHNVS